MAYLTDDQRQAFGRVPLDAVITFFSGAIDPDQVYTPEQLFRCLARHHRGFLREEIRKLERVPQIEREELTDG